MDFGLWIRVAGVGLSYAKETPRFRSYLTPTSTTLTKSTIMDERTQVSGRREPASTLKALHN